MFTDEQIQQESARLEAVIGPSLAGWYVEASRLWNIHSEGGEVDAETLLWVTRVREVIRIFARDFGELVQATKVLLGACARVEDCGGQRIRDAMDESIRHYGCMTVQRLLNRNRSTWKPRNSFVSYDVDKGEAAPHGLSLAPNPKDKP